MRARFAMVLLAAFTALASGADKPLAWPQFRGPGGAGVADDQRPPVEIGPEKNVKWKVAVADGLSSPIIAADKLVITAFQDGKLYTIAYNRVDGKEVWRAEAPAKKVESYLKGEGSPAASTSATDGERIVSYFGSCGLFCYDLAGQLLWKFELPMAETFGGVGTGASPIISDGKVVLLRDQLKDPKIPAIDVASGALQWERKRESRGGYCTPVIWDTPAGRQVAAPGFGRMIGYDLKSGDEKWFVAGMPASSCASPVTAGSDLFFAAWSPGDPEDKGSSDFKMPTFDEVLKGGDADKDGVLSKKESEKTPFKDFFDSNDANTDGKLTRDEWDAILAYLASSKNTAFALQPGGTGDVTTSHVRWKKTKGLPYVPSAIVYRGQHVMVKDGGIVTAYDIKTGDEVYQKRVAASGKYFASPVAANGNIYFTSVEDGVVTVVKAGSADPQVVSQNPPLGERVSATPAIANDTLYIRTAGYLYAFGTSAAGR